MLKRIVNVSIIGFVILTGIILLHQIPFAEEIAIVSGHPDYAPFMWQDGDKIAGAAIEVVEMIFQDLGINVESKYVGPWKRVQKNLEYGNIDLLCAAYITDKRRKYAQFSLEPLWIEPTMVFVWHSKVFPFESWDDLKGKTFGELIGASQGQKFDNWRKQNTSIEYVSKRRLNIVKLEA